MKKSPHETACPSLTMKTCLSLAKNPRVRRAGGSAMKKSPRESACPSLTMKTCSGPAETPRQADLNNSAINQIKSAWSAKCFE